MVEEAGEIGEHPAVPLDEPEPPREILRRLDFLVVPHLMRPGEVDKIHRLTTHDEERVRVVGPRRTPQSEYVSAVLAVAELAHADELAVNPSRLRETVRVVIYPAFLAELFLIFFFLYRLNYKHFRVLS